ncbi:hypothetical protein ASE36_00060 [Rhizobium sp. Root274]|nr:hypothetical protein ASC71_00060 [Rhizobium sp. Root1240]KRD32280.1 hypothetical protein ASE36_00060 [Rhizobium sp. Root274]
MGAIVVTWSFVDRIVDILVSMMAETPGAAKHLKVDRNGARAKPTNFADKMKFLKRALRTEPAAAPILQEIEAAIAQCEQLGEFRHTVCHGTLTAYVEETRRVIFARFSKSGGRRDLRAITLDDLFEVPIHLNQLVARLQEIVENLHGRIGNDTSDELA